MRKFLKKLIPFSKAKPTAAAGTPSTSPPSDRLPTDNRKPNAPAETAQSSAITTATLTTPRHDNGQDALAEATVSTANTPAIVTNSTHESLPSDPSVVSEGLLAATATTVPAPRNENRQNEAPAVGRGALANTAAAVATPGDSTNVDHIGKESMYRAVSPKILPQKTYLSILVAQYDGQSLRNDISGEYRLTTLRYAKENRKVKSKVHLGRSRRSVVEPN
jgi:hypothetical protein